MHLLKQLSSVFAGIVLCLIALLGCGNQSQKISDNSIDVLHAEVVLTVQVPAGTPETDTIYLDLVDEVTGLAFNTTRYQMEPVSPQIYEIRIPVPLGSIIKYRYSRQGSITAIEYNADQVQVRYRILDVSSSVMVSDHVAAWIDLPYMGGLGRIEGRAVDQNGNPAGNQLISVGGKNSISHTDGTFHIDGLTPGLHNLVFYSMDGAYRTFQQGVMIAENAITPTEFVVQSIPGRVRVTFVVQTPSVTPPQTVLRLIANYPALGNTYGDLQAGMSTVASRAPILSTTGDGKYSITLELPVGYDLRYKYTFGDGFWNAELNPTGGFIVRQVIVPDKDTIISDSVSTWNSKGKGEIHFEVQAPDNTPPSDIVSIQFHTFAWFEPIPMWPMGSNTWSFSLSGPLQFFDKIQYRYCRNDQCEISHDQNDDPGDESLQEILITSSPQTIKDSISQWSFWPSTTTPTTIVALNVIPRGTSFFAGIELTEGYSPEQQPYFPLALNRFTDIGVNWLIVTPSWHYLSQRDSTLPLIEAIPGADPTWQDTTEMISISQSKNLNVALFPRILTSKTEELWWKEQILNNNWWNNWYKEYERFILHYASMADQKNIPAIIIGGPEVVPSLTGAYLPNSNIVSGSPVDASERWKQILQKVRGIYAGKIIWAISSDQLQFSPDFLNEVDAIYVLFSEPLSTSSEADQETLRNTAASKLDMQVYPLYSNFQRPIILGVYYPSVKDASMGCSNPEDACRYFDYSEPVNLDEQVNIYTALLSASNERSWISGFVSRGYFSAVAAQDKSASINGKPASDILWYWFPRILGPIQ
jgi:hypothetical protein